jgi:tetratricopeptide (TPR) repeat protein
LIAGAAAAACAGCAPRAAEPPAPGAAAPAGHAGHGSHAPPAAAPADAVPLYGDLGAHHHAVSTSVPRAQQYFDQGLRLVYAFNHDEAHRAFAEAATLDPECVMAYWGMALALGPNINLPYDPDRERMAWEALEAAKPHLAKATPNERAYVEALAVRYAADPAQDRERRQVAYAEAMRAVAKRFPDDLDAQTLAAEAMMDLRPWQLWSTSGEPAPGTLEIVAALEDVLRRNPEHPGANHYYIHAVEASPYPERALPSAERVGRLMPGAGHIVHMPSHVYMRVGRYADAAESNRQAVAADERYFEVGEPSEIYRSMYATHNVHFLWAAAAMEGRSAEALASAKQVSASVPPALARAMPMVQYFQPTYLFALLRFGRWPEVMAVPAPPADLGYELGMWHFARGFALAAEKKPADAARELAALGRIARETPEDLVVGLNSARRLLELASAVLAGEVAAARGNVGDAERELRAAVRLEDALSYDEPPPWFLPVRQLLGALLLADRRPAAAVAVYRDDLARNPHNGWSLLGLAQALRAEGDAKGAAEAEAQFRRAWANADVQLARSRF